MDLRSFIARLVRSNRLVKIEREVDWRLEIGEISTSHHTPVLFEKIREYPVGRVFTNGLSSISDVGLALGMEEGLESQDVTEELRKRSANPIKPANASFSILTEVQEGDKIDILRFPVPQWNLQDCGRYLGTWHINVSKDPETGSRNVGIYRMQVLSPKTATVSASGTSHIVSHLVKAERHGAPLEMAVAIGVPEAVIMSAAAAYPYGQDEYELAGGLEQQSLALVKCATVGLEVPAQSEIVIEGVIHPNIRIKDGPFFDYTGEATVNPNGLLFEVTRIAHRPNPIFRGTAVGRPGAEDHQLFRVLAAIGLWDFHGSRVKHKIQSGMLRRQMYRGFQWAGGLGWPRF